MKTRDFFTIVVSAAFLFSPALFAADVVPYTVQSIKSKGSGYVDLVGPGKTELNGEIFPYEGTKYIRVVNIGTLSGVTGETKGCVLAYSSEDYTENIFVTQQSCNQILSVIESAK